MVAKLPRILAGVTMWVREETSSQRNINSQANRGMRDQTFSAISSPLLRAPAADCKYLDAHARYSLYFYNFRDDNDKAR